MFSPESLRDKALLALEEAVQETRYHVPRRSLALRFALAYLFATGPGAGRPFDRRPFDELWRALFAEKSPWSFSMADTALSGVYRAIGAKRDEEIAMMLWRRLGAEMGQASKEV
jgi:hypothetical protein